MRSNEPSRLHIGKSWTEGSSWLFIAKSSQAGAVVITFELDEDQMLPDLVPIVPYGFLTTDKLQTWHELLDIHSSTGLTYDIKSLRKVILSLHCTALNCNYTSITTAILKISKY
jgi:hypothetical protein